MPAQEVEAAERFMVWVIVLCSGNIVRASFPCFFEEKQAKPPKKQGLFLSAKTPKSLGKKGKTLKKASKFLAFFEKKKKQGNPEKQGKEDQGIVRADYREGDEDSNFSILRVQRFTEWPGPLH